MTDEENEERNMVLRCLDMVLRVCGDKQLGGDTKGKGKEMMEDLADDDEDMHSNVIKRLKVWNVGNETATAGRMQDELPMWSLIQQGSKGEFESGAGD
jgi:hypothetical protein